MARQEGTEGERPRQWEEALVADYHEHHWHEVLDPLCETFRRWKAGELSHADAEIALEKAYKETCALRTLLSQREDRAVALIQWLDREWFEGWIKEHRASAS